MKKNTFLQEEKNSTVLFLWLFYIVFSVYEIIYLNLFPLLPWYDDSAHDVWHDFMFIKYGIMIAIIPLSIYLIKKKRPGIIKYILFSGYFFTNLFSDILFYKDNTPAYTSGNLVELVIILFSPIFVSKRFTYYISLGLLLKYILVGLFIKAPLVLFPISILIVLSFISFLILLRF